ncbi:hypothetical protein ELI00_12855 [Rhizobium ruizarguesonis]|nr:hypothetical protein ELI42_12765 [Rhizobium ruizarguesonis]TAU63908.1 hypothetical protein ELI44_12800 [Rhizobium ruizarguesonis]TAX77050.1 hypothetical protein ELI00_12855 [Rhizobium ruizarguesonis]
MISIFINIASANRCCNATGVAPRGRIVFGVDLFSADLEKFFGERTDAATSGLAATSIARYGLRAAPVFFP